MTVRVMISGRSYDRAAEVPESLTLADGASVDEAVRAIEAALPEGSRLPPTCLVAVSGQHLGTLASHKNRVLADGDELVLIVPVAGG